MTAPEIQVVTVEFYAPGTIHVPGDYTDIQVAIDNANNNDVIVIAPGIYRTSWGYEISGKDLVITSIHIKAEM